MWNFGGRKGGEGESQAQEVVSGLFLEGGSEGLWSTSSKPGVPVHAQCRAMVLVTHSLQGPSS